MVLREAAADDAIVRTPGGRTPLRALDDRGSFLQHILVGISLPARLARGGFSGATGSGHRHWYLESAEVPTVRRSIREAEGSRKPMVRGSAQASASRRSPAYIYHSDAGDTLLSRRRAPVFARQTRQMTTRCAPQGLTKPQTAPIPPLNRPNLKDKAPIPSTTCDTMKIHEGKLKSQMKNQIRGGAHPDIGDRKGKGSFD